MDEVYNTNIKSPVGAYEVLATVDWLRLVNSGLTTKVLLNAASKHRDQDLIARYTNLPGLEGKFPNASIKLPDPDYKGHIITGSPPTPGKLEFELVIASPAEYRAMDIFVNSFLPGIHEAGYTELYDPSRTILWMAMVPKGALRGELRRYTVLAVDAAVGLRVAKMDIDGITVFDDADLDRLRTLTPQIGVPNYRRQTERMAIVTPPGAEPTLRGKE